MTSGSFPPYDPELVPSLEAFMASGMPTEIRPENIQELRTFSEAYVAADDSYVDAELIDHTVPAGPGRPAVDVVVLRPREGSPSDRLPGLLYIHGGGMVSGTNRVALDVPIEWLRGVPMVIVSVDYRVAPEHPHPAPVQDCFAALEWMSDNAAMLGIDPACLLVAGGSAGGGIAAATTLMARDLGGPVLAGQMLMCPMLDDRSIVGSGVICPEDAPWNLVSNTTGWRALLGDAAGGPEVSPYAAPARAADLSGLPPTFVDVGSAELFRDEGVDYATRIWGAGGRAELHVWPGGFHGFDVAVPHSRLSIEAREARVRWLRRVVAEVTC